MQKITFEGTSLHDIICQMSEFMAQAGRVPPPGYGIIAGGLSSMGGSQMANPVNPAAGMDVRVEAARQGGFKQGYEQALRDQSCNQVGPEMPDVAEQQVTLQQYVEVERKRQYAPVSCSAPEEVARAIKAQGPSHRLGPTD